MTTDVTSSFGSTISPAVAGKPTIQVSSYGISADKNTFIKEQDIAICATGLRPSTRLYVFFDGVRLSEFTTPATTNYTNANLKLSDFNPSGVRGAATYTDASGNFAAIVHIPQASFFTGDRQIVVADVDNLNSLSAATTKASYTFNSFNNVAPLTSLQKQSPSIETPVPLDTRGITPISQSFYVGSDGLAGADGIFVTSVDLYFQTKDPTLGITVDIRSIQNGVPTNDVIPYSTVTVPASSINISNDSTTATTITFKAPVFLPADSYYSLTISPDGNNPNYKLYTSVVGAADLVTSSAVIKNWGQGDLFTSTNGNTWVPIPNEFLKFTLKRAAFTSNANSSISLVNKDYEFFYMANSYGYFEQGEYVFQLGSNTVFANSSASSSNVSINQNTYTVTLQGLTGTITSGFTQFTNTAVLIASNGTYYDTVFVNNVTNSTVS